MQLIDLVYQSLEKGTFLLCIDIVILECEIEGECYACYISVRNLCEVLA
jgi:hypothetical protein